MNIVVWNRLVVNAERLKVLFNAHCGRSTQIIFAAGRIAAKICVKQLVVKIFPGSSKREKNF